MRIKETEQAFKDWLVAAQEGAPCEHLYARVTHLFTDLKRDCSIGNTELAILGSKLYVAAEQNPTLTHAILKIMGAFRLGG